MASSASHAPAFDFAAMTAPVAAVDQFLRDFLDQRPLTADLTDAIAYSLFAGGKRLRPVLVCRCCEAISGTCEPAMPAAAAIELIHCFSLVHDDLPAMDDDDLRRGRPTLHRHTNEAMAILAGDAMSVLAFELVVTRIASPQLATAVLRELAGAASEMIAGQVYDTLGGFDAAAPPIERLRIIHRHKTAALIRCACRMGAICGQASDQQLAAASAYGDAIGLMFQVVDDLLDVTQSTEQLGKTAGKDALQDKLTYPGLLGLEATRQSIVELTREAHHALDHLARLPGSSAEHVLLLQQLCDYMAARSN